MFINKVTVSYKFTKDEKYIELSYKFTKDEKYIEHEIVNAGPRTFMFALVPEYMTGKKVKEA